MNGKKMKVNLFWFHSKGEKNQGMQVVRNSNHQQGEGLLNNSEKSTQR